VGLGSRLGFLVLFERIFLLVLFPQSKHPRLEVAFEKRVRGRMILVSALADRIA
jgi:hypothetical protein